VGGAEEFPWDPHRLARTTYFMGQGLNSRTTRFIGQSEY
jgi:hypothetical protein